MVFEGDFLGFEGFTGFSRVVCPEEVVFGEICLKGFYRVLKGFLEVYRTFLGSGTVSINFSGQIVVASAKS